MLNLRSPLSFSWKNNKNEYQQGISSTSNTKFMSILRSEVEGGIQKSPKAVSNRGPISKKNLDFPFFWLKAKI